MDPGNLTNVDGVIITGELARRPSRAPDYENENRALVALAKVMTSDPAQVLQHLAQAAMTLTGAASAGVSLLEAGGTTGSFRWAAAAGAWAPYRDATMPREESPCGEVIQRGQVLLLRHPERAFPALRQAQPAIGEGLLAPFFIDGAPVGTVWVIKHGPEEQFEAEDGRLLSSLADFAAVAYQMVLALDDIEACRRTDRARADAALSQSEARFRAFVVASADAVYRMNADWSEMRQLEGQAFLLDTSEPSETWLDRYIHPDDHAQVHSAIAQAIATTSNFELEHRVIRADGSLGWTRSRAVPILTATGAIAEWLGSASDITAAREAAVARAASEARFRQFAEVSSDVIWVRNADSLQFEYVSPVFETIYGAKLDALLQGDNLQNWAALIHPDDRDRAVDNLQRVKDGERVTHEFRIHHGRTGELRWIRDTDFPLTDEHGRVRGVAGIGQDVTEQKRAEEALREREERLSLIVENARDYAIFTIDSRGLVTDWREGAEAVFGWSRAEAIGMDVRRVFTPEDLAAGAAEREMSVARAEGRAADVRWHLRKDGRRVFIDGALTRLGHGGATDFLKIGQDVTARHRVAEALRESEARLQGLVEGIPQLVWRSNDYGRWTWASPQWLDFTGQTQEESHGMGWLGAVHPDDQATARRAWDEARPRGMLDVEFRVRAARTGKFLWHHTRSVPVRNEHGDIVEWLGTSTDVQVLKGLQERQGVLVAELQHRTRNLMAVVRSISDKTARSSADLVDFRTRFRNRLDALARVQGLLSRLNDMDRVTFDELIKSELAAMDGGTDQVTLAGPIGIRLRSSTVQTLAMALHELATNAIKYGALGQTSGRLAIDWSLQRAGEDHKPWLYVEWRETGVAMPPPGSAARGAGQGRELIERALPYQLGAKTSYELGADGVCCTILLPISATGALDDGRA